SSGRVDEFGAKYGAEKKEHGPVAGVPGVPARTDPSTSLRAGSRDARRSTNKDLAHHGEDANRRFARLLILCRGYDDERAGCRQRGEARGSFHHIAAVESELPRQRPVGGQVHGRLNGKTDSVTSIDEEHRRVGGDRKRR